MQEQNPDYEKLLSDIKPLAEALNDLHQEMLALAMEEAYSILYEGLNISKIHFFVKYIVQILSHFFFNLQPYS